MSDFPFLTIQFEAACFLPTWWTLWSFSKSISQRKKAFAGCVVIQYAAYHENAAMPWLSIYCHALCFLWICCTCCSLVVKWSKLLCVFPFAHSMADGEDTCASYHSVAAGARVIQQLGGPEFIKVFLVNLTNGREDLVYDSEIHPPTILQQQMVWANEFWQPPDQ